MVIFGGIVGLILGFPFVAIPLASSLALVLGVTVALPPAGPVFTAPLALMLLAHAVIVLIVYIVASIAQPLPAAGGGVAPVSQIELFCRGFLIGLNTCCNFAVLLVLAPLTTVFASLVQSLAWAVGTLNVLAVFPLAGNPFYRGVLGWFSLAMPMAWPGTVLGLLWYVLNVVFAPFFPTRFFIDWPTGVFFIEGSITGLHPTALGYDIGSFCFITPRVAPRALVPGEANITSEGVAMHEAGHALNNAALGPWFGVANVLDATLRTILGQSTRNAYGEMVAESHLRGSGASGQPWVDFWSPFVGPSGPTAGNVAPAGNVLGLEPAIPLGTPQTRFALTSGSVITLDASGVADPDGYLLAALAPPAGAPLVFLWELAPNPNIAINATAIPIVTLTVGIGGDAPLLTFRVSDGAEGSFVACLISVVEARPNGPYAGTVNQPVALTAAGSTAGTFGTLPSLAAPGVPALSLLWAITQQPAGSNAVLSDPAAENPTFTADRQGLYRVSLTVTENGGVSHGAVADIQMNP